MITGNAKLLADDETRMVGRSDSARLTSPRGRARARLLIVAEVVTMVALAFVVRVIGIAHQSLWLDEAFSVFLASHRLPQILSFVASSDAHPPLYYLILHTWMALFGASPAAVRWLSLVASVAATLVTYLVGRKVASHNVALLATLFMALSSFQVWYAQETRMYALTTLATLVALYGLVRALDDFRPASWSLYAGGMLVACYLDYSAFYVALAVVVWFWFVGRHRHGVAMPFIASTALVIVGYLPWLPSFFQQLQSVGGLTAWISSANGTGLLSVITDFYFNWSNLSQASNTLIGIGVTALSVALTAYALWVPRHNAAYPLLALWVSCPLALGFVSEFFNHPITIARTMMIAEPALLILLAMAAQIQVSHFSVSIGQRISAVALGILLIALIWGNATAQVTANTSPLKEDWRGAATYVSTHQQPGDLILFNAYFSQMPFDYYYQQSAAGAAHTVAERGYQLEESLMYADLTPAGQGVRSANELESYGRVWLVVSHEPSASDAIPPQMATHFRLVSSQRLVGVTLLLYLKSA